MLLEKKFIIWSLVGHLIIVLIASIVQMHYSSLHKTFVVFGAHSQKPHHVMYKTFKNNAVPFAAGAGIRSGKSKNTKSTQNIQKAKSGNTKQATNGKTIHTKPSEPSKKAFSKKSAATTQAVKTLVPKAHQIQKKEAAVKTTSKSKAQKKISPLLNTAVTKQTLTEPSVTKDTVLKKKQSQKSEPCAKAQAAEPIKQPENSDQKISENETSSIADHVNEVAEMDDAPSSAEEIIDVDIGPQEFNPGEILIYKKEIQQEVDRLWKPPVGVARSTTCSINFAVSTDGKVTCTFAQRSPVLIYDLSVMRAARMISFPKALWGKQIKIAFHQ